MTDNEWMRSVRKRTHDLSNKMMLLSEEHAVTREHLVDIRRRIVQIEALEDSVRRLEHQSQVLKWLLGLFSTVACAIVLRLL